MRFYFLASWMFFFVVTTPMLLQAQDKKTDTRKTQTKIQKQVLNDQPEEASKKAWNEAELGPYCIAPPDLLSIEVVGLPKKSVELSGEYLVGPDGTINLHKYGKARVTGKTVSQATKAIENHLGQFLSKPEVSINVAAINSKQFYVIFPGKKGGDNIVSLSCTGYEMVSDVLSEVHDVVNPSDKKIRLVRYIPERSGYRTFLADYQEVLKGTKNYRLQPSDRVFVGLEPKE